MTILGATRTSLSPDSAELLEPPDVFEHFQPTSSEELLRDEQAYFPMHYVLAARTAFGSRTSPQQLVVNLPEGVDLTDAFKAFQQILEDLQDVANASTQPEAGAPSAALLVSAASEIGSWLQLTQMQVMHLVGMSPSTVMSWKREPATRPRHRNVPVLVSLWAAVSGAWEQFGPDETLRMVWSQQTIFAGRTDGSAATQLSTRLIEATTAAGRAEFEMDDDYDPEAPLPVNVEELAAAELELSTSLTEYLGTGEPEAG